MLWDCRKGKLDFFLAAFWGMRRLLGEHADGCEEGVMGVIDKICDMC